MPTPTKGPRLGGSPQHQRSILANLATALFQHGRITTTQAKAKALRPLAEKLVTFAKKGDLHARRQVLTVVRDKSVVHTLFTEIGPRYAERLGGYTRITKIGPRKGDNAPMAVIELVESQTVGQVAVGEAERARGTRFARRKGAAGAAPGDVELALSGEGDAAEAPEAAATGEEAVEAEAVEAEAVEAEAVEAEAVEAEADVVEGDVVEAEPEVAATEAVTEVAEPVAADAEAPPSGDTDSGAGHQADSADETSQAEGEAEPTPES